jgi:purine nucleoside permease
MRAVRAGYDAPAARRAPAVGIGSTLSTQTFWLGARMDAWARRWVPYLTDGRGTFRTTETNDAGTMAALAALGEAGRVDPNRVLLLRAASNFDAPPRGVFAAGQLVREGPGSYAAYLPALDALYRTGSRIVGELRAHWARYAAEPPA